MWTAFIGSNALIGGIAWYMSQSAEPSETAELLRLPLLALGLVLAGLSLWGVRKIAKFALPYYLLRWALAEAIGLFGLILAVLGAPMASFLPFHVAAILLVVLAGPSAEEIRSFPAPPPRQPYED